MKFKVGDEVRRLTRGYNINIGEICIINDIKHDKWFVLQSKDNFEYDACEFELVSRISEPTSDIISLDYRVEYHKKVEECELLQAKYDYLWHTILKEK